MKECSSFKLKEEKYNKDLDKEKPEIRSIEEIEKKVMCGHNELQP